jgi:hypothetical protein
MRPEFLNVAADPQAMEEDSGEDTEDEEETPPVPPLPAVAAAAPEAETPKSLETLNPDTGYVPPDRQEDKGDLQLFLEDDHKFKASQRVSYVYMLVLTHFPEWEIDEKEPYVTYNSAEIKKKKPKKYKTLQITKKIAIWEIKRANPQYRPNSGNKLLEDIIKELQSAHMKNLSDDDLEYLKYEERELRRFVTKYLSDLKDKLEGKTKAPPHVKSDRMRLICCFQFEHIVDAYRKSQVPLTRTQLDAGKDHPDTLADSFENLVIEQFNREEWVAKSMQIPDLHEDFAEQVEWHLRPEYRLDRQKLKTIMTWEKSFIMALIRDYEASGMGTDKADDMYQLGEGEDTWEDEDGEIHKKYGHFNLDIAIINGGDDRKNFLRGRPSDILYWWHVLDSLDMITMACAMFKKGIGASSDTKPPPVSDTASLATSNGQEIDDVTRKRKSKNKKGAMSPSKRHKELMAGQRDLIKSNQNVSEEMKDMKRLFAGKELDRLRDRAFDLELKIDDMESEGDPANERKLALHKQRLETIRQTIHEHEAGNQN